MTDDRYQWLLGLMRGNVPATQFLAQMVKVLHLWDDLIDKDKEVLNGDVHEAFQTMLITLPNNEFYVRNIGHLQPILVNAIINWKIANQFELLADEYRLRIAYILRSSYCDLITQSAMVIGGWDYAVLVGMEVRMNAHNETWEGYLENLAAEKAARKE